MKRKIRYLFLMLTCVAALPACTTLKEFPAMEGFPATYSAEAIEGWIVDAQTNQPVEDVIVVAHWELESAYTPGQMMVMETVTDENGRFHFPAWGPKPRPALAALTFRDPELVMFKSGYDFVTLQNTPKSYYNKDSLRRSEWNGKTIKMKPFKDYIIQDGRIKTSVYAERIGWIQSSIDWAYSSSCDLKYIPRMIVALYLQKKKFREQGIYSSLPSFDHFFNDTYPDRCDVRKTLQKYLP